jgi:cytochrome c oxidase subunit 2
MKTFLKIIAVAAAFGLAPAGASAQQTDGTAAQAAQNGQTPERVAPAAAQTAAPSPAVTGAPSEASTASAPTSSRRPPQPRPRPDAVLFDRHPPRAERRPAGRAHGPAGPVQPDRARGGGLPQLHPDAGDHLISLFVLFLMLYVIVRYRRAAHPVPSRTTHNTLVECCGP